MHLHGLIAEHFGNSFKEVTWIPMYFLGRSIFVAFVLSAISEPLSKATHVRVPYWQAFKISILSSLISLWFTAYIRSDLNVLRELIIATVMSLMMVPVLMKFLSISARNSAILSFSLHIVWGVVFWGLLLYCNWYLGPSTLYRSA